MAYPGSMTEILTTTPGLYPLPDWAKDELPNLKGRQKGGLVTGDEGPEVEDAYQRAREEVVDLQTEAGVDLPVEGQLRWDDMLTHPLSVADAVETRGIVRYFDNNNFYREPVVTDDLSATGDVAAELESAADLTDEGLNAVLPGPYTLSQLATDENYGDDAEFLSALADFLAAEAEQFPDVETLFLLEPSLLESPPGEGEDERASEAIDAVASAADADVVAHTYWESHGGDGGIDEKVYAHLLDADIDAVGFDFVANHEDNAYVIGEYGCTDDIALGIVDGQNTLVEDADKIAERVEWTLDQAHGSDFDTAYAAVNTPTFYLPSGKFEQKLAALGAVERTEVTA